MRAGRFLLAFGLLASCGPGPGGRPNPDGPGAGEGAGAGWSVASVGEQAALYSVAFADRRTGFAVGARGAIFITRDGGATWARRHACAGARPCSATSADRIRSDLKGVAVPAHNVAYAAGLDGTLLATTDGGETWASRFACAGGRTCRNGDSRRVRADLSAVSFADARRGVAVGAGGTILSTRDGGRKWRPRFACTNPAVGCTQEGPGRVLADLMAVAMPPGPDALDAHAVGAGGTILRTRDGGVHWSAEHACGPAPPGQQCGAGSPHRVTAGLSAVASPEPGEVFAAGEEGTLISLSAADPSGWRAEAACPEASGCPPSQTLRTSLRAISFSDTGHGLAVGSDGTVVSTVRAPGTRQDASTGVPQVASPVSGWRIEPKMTGGDLNAVSFPDPNTGYAVGGKGLILSYRARRQGPAVTSVRPAGGPTIQSPGQVVTIRGTGFTQATAVFFGGVASPRWTALSDTMIRAARPGRAPGDARVIVSGAGGSSQATAASRFVYRPPAGGRWSVGPECPSACSGPAVGLPGGRILFPGGRTGVGPSRVSVAFDPGTGRWQREAPLAVERFGHAVATLPGGKVLVAGGQLASGEPTSATEIYDPAVRRWSPGPVLASPRFGAVAVSLPGGSVLIVGGTGKGAGGAATAATAEVLDPVRRRWSPAAAPRGPRLGHTATPLPGGRVLVVGSSFPGAGPEIYDPSSASWSLAPAMINHRFGHTATPVSGGRILVAGGVIFGKEASDAEIYDPRTNRWNEVESMVIARAGHTATALSGGRVLVAGGSSSRLGPPLGFVEIFDPAPGRWGLAASMTTARRDHTAVAITGKNCRDLCGRVLVSGGACPGCGASAGLESSELFIPPPR